MTQKPDELSSSLPGDGPNGQEGLQSEQPPEQIDASEPSPAAQGDEADAPEAVPLPFETLEPETETVEPADLPGRIEQPVRESRLRRAVRQGVLWILGLLFVFLLGGLVVYFTIYQPVNNQLTAANAALQVERQNITDLQELLSSQESQITALQNQIAESTSKYDALQDQLDSANLHILVLRAHTDVNAARLAILNKNLEEADLYLSNLPELLAEITAGIGSQQGEVMAAIQQRLELVTDEFKRDPDTAEGDLKIIAERFTQLENTMFTIP